MEWLEQQPDLTAEHHTSGASVPNFIEMIKVSHISNAAYADDTRFSVSECSGSVGIASWTEKPSLSVMYPGTDKNPLILSVKDRYTSALFIAISDQEYLAAATRNDIRVWNLEKSTSNVAFKFNERKVWRLCVIDKRTIACVAEKQSSDGFSKIYILNTDSEKFTLSGTILLKVGGKITDMCYLKTTDNTSCLLLNCSSIMVVKCVEIVGGKVRWQVDEQQIGRHSLLSSICTDGSTVFVTDPLHCLLHLLSVEDGSVVTSINLGLFGLSIPTCVRLQGEYLYVGHENKTLDTYCISKFAKPSIQDSD